MFGLLIFVAVLSVLVLFIRHRYSYWQRYNIPFVKPTFPFGSTSLPKKGANITQQISKLYLNNKSDCPILGIFFFLYPMPMLVDLELIRTVLIKDFKSFSSRKDYYNEKDDPLSASLVNIEYDRWKPLRQQLTPSFSTGKIRGMFPTIVTIGRGFVDYLSETTEANNEVEIRDILSRFLTDVIGACAFGIECNSLRNPDTLLRKMGKKIFDEPKLNFFKHSFVMLYPKLGRFFGVRKFYKEVTDFFTDMAYETVKHRTQNKSPHNDFMEFLVQSKISQGMTMNNVAAQALAFFTGGFETSSLALTYCLYELALEKNKHIQERARNEIQSVLMEHDGNLTYEALADMTYCEQIIYETLRKYPPVATISRSACEAYEVPNTSFEIPKGTILLLPVLGIHHDPAYYPDPEEFNPLRFSPEEIKKRPSCSFLAFGDGPRSCIASRFGMLQMRIALVCLLQNFEFSTCSRTEIPLEFCPKKLVLSPKGDVWLAIKRVYINK